MHDIDQLIEDLEQAEKQQRVDKVLDKLNEYKRQFEQGKMNKNAYEVLYKTCIQDMQRILGANK